MKHVKSLTFLSIGVVALILLASSCGSEKALIQLDQKTQELYAIKSQVDAAENEVAYLRNKVNESERKVAELHLWREKNNIK